MDIGYKDDDIFLLSADEYEHYKRMIPHENCCWWLRSPGNRQHYATFVNLVVSVCYYGLDVSRDDLTVRPALKYSNLESQIIKSSIYKDRFLFHEFPFRIIDEENKIAIAEVPITFDMFDEESNDYETSYIRRKFLAWFKTGVWDHE